MNAKGRAWAPVVLLVSASFGGCTCSRESIAPGPQSTASAASSAAPSARASAPAAPPSSASAAGQTAGLYSAPIGAAVTGAGNVVAAALVAHEKKVVVTGLGGAAPGWTHDAFLGVEWTSDARISVFPLGDGAAVVWSGPHEAGSGQSVALFGSNGEAKGPPFEIGTSMPCATQGAFVWAERKDAKSPPVVRARSLAAGAPHNLASFVSETTPELVCGDHVVFAIAEDDEDGRNVRAFPESGAAATGADAGAPKPAFVDDPFDDEENDFEEYTVGDVLGLVRVGKSGSVNMAETTGGSKRITWKRVASLGSDDAVEVIDADANTLYVVYTTDEGESCPGAHENGVAKSISVVRVDRKAGTAADPVKIAPSECGKDVGPFWMGELPQGMMLGWAERGGTSDAPIRGFAFHSLAAGTEAAPIARGDQPADALVDAGCDKLACFVVALSRESGNDGMAPEPLKLLRYP